jgi:hypothetical protein
VHDEIRSSLGVEFNAMQGEGVGILSVVDLIKDESLWRSKVPQTKGEG